MSDESVAITDDQSHYEISLTAGQAFIAFVLLLLSLAASFTFGLMIGKGQGDERLVVRKEPTVVTEASAVRKKPAGKIVELGVPDEDFKQPAAAKTETTTTTDRAQALSPVPAPVVTTTVTPTVTEGQAGAPVFHATPAYAQLLSTSDQKTAEALAAKLINGGFTTAFVERSTTDKGMIFRVRVKFLSEADARAAEAKLKEYSKEVWITK
jgi:cell division septation protein DedD